MVQESASTLADILFSLVPEDGATIGNKRLKEQFKAEAVREGYSLAEGDFEAAWQQLLDAGVLVKGRGRGSSVRRAEPDPEGFALAAQEPAPADEGQEAPKKSFGGSGRQGKTKRGASGEGSRVLSYRHGDKRKNNPHVGLVDASSDAVAEPWEWRYDPHLDPALQFDDSRPDRAQIGDLIDTTHVREMLDEVFGAECHVCDILVKKKGPQKGGLIDPVNDYLLWYGRSPRESGKIKFRTLFQKRPLDAETLSEFKLFALPAAASGMLPLWPARRTAGTACARTCAPRWTRTAWRPTRARCRCPSRPGTTPRWR